MKQEYLDMIYIAKQTVLNKPIEKNEFDYLKLFTLSKAHSLLAFIYTQVSSFNIDAKLKEKAEKYVYAAALKEAKQEYYLNMICDLLNENQIFHVLLKGTLLKKYYKPSYLRIMGDIDLFIYEKDRNKIIEIMRKKGFEPESQNSSHLNYRLDKLVEIEFHPKLFSENNKTHSHFENYYKHAVCINKYTYELKKEYHLIYLIGHFAQHLMGGGSGYRTIIDLAYYMKENNFDYKLIEEELSKINLDKLFYNIKGILRKDFEFNFEETISDDTYSIIHNLMFESGTYGFLDEKKKVENSVSVLYKNKFQYLLYIIFLPYNVLKYKYKILNKLPFLLPVFWVVRWFDLFILKFRRTIRKLGTLRLKKKNIEKAKENYKKIGL